MLAHRPEGWPRLFVEHLNASDLSAVVALYEPDARFVDRSGETLAGRDVIRPMLSGMIDSKTQLQSQVVKAVTVGDVALLYTDFRGTTVDASGKTVGRRTSRRSPPRPAGRLMEAHRRMLYANCRFRTTKPLCAGSTPALNRSATERSAGR